ncbi:MAG: outer membrane protein assembly factor BamD [Paracoccaceae bacterium]
MSGAFQGIRVVSVLLALVILAGCSGGSAKQVGEGTPATEIIGFAESELADGNFKAAAEYYNEVERLHPYSAEAKQALIGAAKAYREKQMYPESRAAALRYLDFYPTTADAPFAMYLVGLSYYDQIIDVERDQRNTFKSLKVFRKLIETYPGSEYARLAEEKFGTALNQLAGKEMDIGRYYLQRGHFVAAIERFRVVVSDYGDTPQSPEALYRLVEGYLSLGLIGEAQAAASLLATRYPDNEWRRDADRLMARG